MRPGSFIGLIALVSVLAPMRTVAGTTPSSAAGVTDGMAAETANEAIDRRLHRLAQQLRCLVCQNETLADSQAALAVDLRREIRERMQRGDSDAKIAAFLTDRYGDFVLYRPPLKPATYALWFGPFALLAAGLATLFRGLAVRGVGDAQAVSAAERRQARVVLAGTRPRGSRP